MTEEPDKAYLGWPQFGDAIWMLAKTMDENGEDPDSIVGIARGGLLGAVYLSHYFDAELSVAPASKYEGTDDTGNVEVGDINPAPHGDVVIFDDIVDDGDTMGAVNSLVAGMTPPTSSLTTVAVNVKPGREFEPDYWVEQTDAWVVYPWEAGEQ